MSNGPVEAFLRDYSKEVEEGNAAEGLSRCFRFDQHFVGEGTEGGADAEQGSESGVSGAATVEAKDELVEVGLEMLAAQAVIGGCPGGC